MINSEIMFDVFFLNVLKILFLWFGSGIGVMYFVEKHKGCSVAEDVLSNFWYIFATMNVVLTIVLLVLKDFRIILSSTIVMCFIYYLLLKKMNIKALRNECRKKYRRQVLNYEMAKKKYF